MHSKGPNQKGREMIVIPDGHSSSIPIDAFQPPPPSFKATGPDTMKQWFAMKFLDDVSDIRPEQYPYYKYHVHHFIDTFFTPDKISGKKILDIGCGPGFYSVLLADRGALVTGIDQEEFLIHKANELKASHNLSNVQFIRGNFIPNSGRWSYGEFDYILAIDTIVSLDYMRAKHAHDDAVRLFRGVRRLLNDQGRFYIIESHPFFGRVLREVVSDTGTLFCVREAHYKFDSRPPGDPNHWFTLDEMTRASCESGLAISHIYEPEPDPAMQQTSPGGYTFRRRYPGMIVYEMCKMMGV